MKFVTTTKLIIQTSMIVRQARVKMEELVLMASIPILVTAISGLKELTAKLILTIVRLLHVKTVEPALMESIHILVIASLGMQETTVK